MTSKILVDREVAESLLPRIAAAIKRITEGQACMRIPADLEDPDLVLAECRSILRAALAGGEASEASPEQSVHSALPSGCEHSPGSSKEPRFQWCCAKGCGPCDVKRHDFEYQRTATLNGELVESKTMPRLVSKCCGFSLLMWDNERDEEVDIDCEPLPYPIARGDGEALSPPVAPQDGKDAP